MIVKGWCFEGAMTEEETQVERGNSGIQFHFLKLCAGAAVEASNKPLIVGEHELFLLRS